MYVLFWVANPLAPFLEKRVVLLWPLMLFWSCCCGTVEWYYNCTPFLVWGKEVVYFFFFLFRLHFLRWHFQCAIWHVLLQYDTFWHARCWRSIQKGKNKGEWCQIKQQIPHNNSQHRTNTYATIGHQQFQRTMRTSIECGLRHGLCQWYLTNLFRAHNDFKFFVGETLERFGSCTHQT